MRQSYNFSSFNSSVNASTSTNCPKQCHFCELMSMYGAAYFRPTFVLIVSVVCKVEHFVLA